MASPAPVDVVARPVWGKSAAPPSAPASTATNEKASDEEECKICFDRKITNTFQPCKHGACSDCVDSLRHSVIFKADKGVKCPYCRQFILGFELTGTTGDSKAKQKLKESNAAAKAAALARMPAQKKVTDPNAAKSVPGGANMWVCPKCQNSNLEKRKVCNRCNEVAPLHVLQQMVAGGKLVPDIAKASRKEIQEWATAKLHPKLNVALGEAGMPFNISDGSFLGGDLEGVKAAVLRGGHKKLRHVMECLLGDGCVGRLSTELYYGNYTLQDLILAGSRLRAAVLALQKSGQLSKEEADAARGVNASGRDLLGRIAVELGEVSAAVITHQTGNYVLEKMIDYGDTLDVMAIIRPLCANPWAFHHHRYGMMKFAKGVDKLGGAALESGPLAEEVSLLLNNLCQTLLKPENKPKPPGHVDRLTYLMFNDLAGPMILEAAQGGLPHDSAIKLLGQVVESANALKSKGTGMNVLKKFLGLEARNSTCREIIVTNVCILAKELRNSYADTMVTVTDGADIIQRMLELLSQEEDVTCREWVACIVHELVEQSPKLWQSQQPQAKAVLLSSMRLPHTAASIPGYLEMVRRKYGKKFCAQLATALYPEAARPGAEKSPISQFLVVDSQPPKRKPKPQLPNGKAPGTSAAAPESNHSSRAPTPPSTPPPEPEQEQPPVSRRSSEAPVTPFSPAKPTSSGQLLHHSSPPPAGFGHQGFQPAHTTFGDLQLHTPPQMQAEPPQQPEFLHHYQEPQQRIQQHIVVTPPLETSSRLPAAPPGIPPPRRDSMEGSRSPTQAQPPQPAYPSRGNPPQPLAHESGTRAPPPAAKAPMRMAQGNAAQDFLGDLLPGLGLSDMLQNGPSGGHSNGGSYQGSSIPTAESVLAAAPRGAPPRHYHGGPQHTRPPQNRPAYMPPAARNAAPSEGAAAPPTPTARFNPPGVPTSHPGQQPPLQNGGGRIPMAAAHAAPRQAANPPPAPAAAGSDQMPPAGSDQMPPGLTRAQPPEGGHGRNKVQMSSRVQSMYGDLLGGRNVPPPAAAALAPAAPPPAQRSQGPPPAAARRMPAAAAAPQAPVWAQKQESAESWSCAVCTYHHQGAEADFLTCKLCGSVR